jgi:hypothetical protein
VSKAKKLYLLVRIVMGIKFIWVLFSGPVPAWAFWGIGSFLALSALISGRTVWCMWIRKDNYVLIRNRYKKSIQARTEQLESARAAQDKHLCLHDDDDDEYAQVINSMERNSTLAQKQGAREGTVLGIRAVAPVMGVAIFVMIIMAFSIVGSSNVMSIVAFFLLGIPAVIALRAGWCFFIRKDSYVWLKRHYRKELEKRVAHLEGENDAFRRELGEKTLQSIESKL